MADDKNIKYTIEQSTTGQQFGSFAGNGDVENYPEPYRSYARNADSGQEFSAEIEGERHNNLVVLAEELGDDE